MSLLQQQKDFSSLMAPSSAAAFHNHHQQHHEPSAGAAGASSAALFEDDPLLTDLVLSSYYNFGDLNDFIAPTSNHPTMPSMTMSSMGSSSADSSSNNSSGGGDAGGSNSSNSFMALLAGGSSSSNNSNNDHPTTSASSLVSSSTVSPSPSSSSLVDLHAQYHTGNATVAANPFFPFTAAAAAATASSSSALALTTPSAPATAAPGAAAVATATTPVPRWDNDAFMAAATAAAAAAAKGQDPNAAATAAYVAATAASAVSAANAAAAAATAVVKYHQTQGQGSQRLETAALMSLPVVHAAPAAAGIDMKHSPKSPSDVSTPPTSPPSSAFTLPNATVGSASLLHQGAPAPYGSFSIGQTAPLFGAPSFMSGLNPAAAAVMSGNGGTGKIAISRLATANPKPVKQVSKAEKKIAHNAIERRYRHNINEHIQELKNVIPSCKETMSGGSTAVNQSKLNKATILRKAIDYISHLQNSANRMREDNAAMKAMLNALGIDISSIVKGNYDGTLEPFPSDGGHIKREDMEPYSDSDDLDDESRTPSPPLPGQMMESDSSDESVSMPARPHKSWKSSSSTSSSTSSSSSSSSSGRGRASSMKDGSRMLLFVLMFAVMFVSPFDSYLSAKSAQDPSPSSAAAGSSRTLNSVELLHISNYHWLQSVLIQSAWWVFKLVFALACLARVFFSEPVIIAKGLEFQTAHDLQKVALTDLSKGDRASAELHTAAALESLHRPFPVSTPELLIAVAWQLVRQLLHRLWFGQWIDAFVANRNADARASFKSAASCFHMLQTIHFMAKPSVSEGSHAFAASFASAPKKPLSSPVVVSAGELNTVRTLLLRVYILLNAVNLAEASRGCISSSFLIEVYVTAALQIKYAFPRRLHFVARYFLTRAKDVRQETLDLDSSLSWIFHPDGYLFLSRGHWRSTFVHQAALSRGTSPIAVLGTMFRTALLDRAFAVLVDQGNSLSALDLLQEARQYSRDCGDADTQWWAEIGMTCAYLRLGKTSEAIQFFQSAELLAANGTRASPMTPVQQSLDQAVRANMAFLFMNDSAAALRLTDEASTILRDDPALILVRHRSGISPSVHFRDTASSASSASSTATDGSSSSDDEGDGHPSHARQLRQLVSSSLLASAGTLSSMPHALAGQILACTQLINNRFALWQWFKTHGSGVAKEKGAAHGAAEEERALIQLVNQLSSGINEDINVLRCLTHSYPPAHALAFLFQAMARSLAGGANSRTKSLFTRALAEARNCKSRYVEGLVLLRMGQMLVEHEVDMYSVSGAFTGEDQQGGAAGSRARRSSSLLQSTPSSTSVDSGELASVDDRRHWLSTASHIFDSLNSVNELELSRSLLKALVDADR